MVKTLDLATRTLLSDFQESVFARTEIERGAEPPVVYVKKQVKGNLYWYSQVYDGGVARQTYIGRDSPALNKQVKLERKKAKENAQHLAALKEQELRLASMLARGGLPLQDRRTSVILSKLSEARMIDGNGVLVGTFAFTAYVGILGVQLDRASLKTQDIDIAQDPTLELAHQCYVNADEFFFQPGLDCRAVPSLSRSAQSASFITKDGLRIDLLVPLIGAGKRRLKHRNISGAGATALRFLDYLIEDPVRTVLISTKGGIPVTVPAPARFSIHKLILAQQRSIHESAKKAKDLVQAQQLIEVLQIDQPDELRKAYREALSRGPKWKKAIQNSLNKLPEETRSVFAGWTSL